LPGTVEVVVPVEPFRQVISVRRLVWEPATCDEGVPMTTSTYIIIGMTCGHCVNVVSSEVGKPVRRNDARSCRTP
jgi:hypothetical protein